MERTSNLQHPSLQSNASGWINGLIGVVIFSGSLPATRVAVLEFDPVFLTVARATLAAILALCLLLLFKEKRPARQQLLPLAIVALGVVVGFPLLTALALQYVTSAHSIVFVGLLPLATAVFGVLRGGERPRPVFWVFSVLGSLLVVGFAASQGLTAAPQGDLLMLLAILACGLGYAEGAKLSRTLGGWQVICWALVLALPIMAAVTWWASARDPRQHQRTGLAQPGVRVTVQHADRLCVLVSRPRPGRNRRRRPTAIAAAVFWPGTGGDLAARTGQPWDAWSDSRGDPLRGRGEKVLPLATDTAL